MVSVQNFATNYEEDQWPSFPKNSCTVTDQGEQSRANSDPCQSSVGGPTSSAESIVAKKTGGQGGFTCCVTTCYNNSKKGKNLSFYAFPSENSLASHKCDEHILLSINDSQASCYDMPLELLMN